MYAEALNETEHNVDFRGLPGNSVRKRARFNGTEELPILPDLSGLSYQEFKDALLQERRWEFVAEGKGGSTGALRQTRRAGAEGQTRFSPRFSGLFPVPRKRST